MSSFEQLASYLNTLNDTTQRLQVKKSTIGSSRDTVEFRNTIKVDINKGKDTINSIKNLLTSGFERSDRPKVNKLTNQFNELRKQFEKESTEIINLQLRNAIGSNGRSGSLSLNNRDASSRSGSLAGKIHPVNYNNNFNNNNNNNNNSYNNNNNGEIQLQQLEITLSNAEPVEELMLEEYNTEVKTLVTELQAIVEISKDLNQLVNEQREPLETANNNTTVASLNVEEANGQLEEANTLACKYRKKIVIIVILVLIIIGLIVGLCVGYLT